MNAQLPPLHLLPGTDLRVGPKTLEYLRRQQASLPAGASLPFLAVQARTGMPINVTLPASALKTN